VSLPLRAKVAILAAVVVLAAATAVGYSVQAAQRDSGPAATTVAAKTANAPALATVLAGPHLVFRRTSLGPSYGKVAAVRLADPDGPPALSDTECERVHVTRGQGICLFADRGVITTYQARLLDARLSPTRELRIAGIPSRARVSPDGRLAAATTFVSGHSYAQTGFSTATTLYDTASGRSLGNPEEFAIVKDGERYSAADVNIWGVTFTQDGTAFYATLSSKGRTHLVAGNVAQRELTVLATDVECPSLSPDETKVAYKRRVGGPNEWRLHVRDLRTGTAHALAEEHSVDDQVEWLNDDQVLYGLPRAGTAETDVWAVPADGSGHPRLFVPNAWSPAVVR
jgi:hypothetical protein